MASTPAASPYMSVRSASDSEHVDVELDAETGAMPPSGRVWLKRLALVGAFTVVAFVGVVATFKVTQQVVVAKGRAEYIPGSHPAFVNYEALPVHRSLLGAAVLAPPEPLCSPAIVSKVCIILNQETTEFWTNRADDSLTEVHAMEISQATSISPQSVRTFFKRLGLTNTDDESVEAYSVSCKELCDRVVGSFPKRFLPNASNVACIQLPNEKANCSVNVNPDELRLIRFPGGTGHSMKQHFHETPAMSKADPANKVAEELLAKIDAGSNSVMFPDQPFEVVRNAVARSFHIFPKMKAEMSAAGNLGFEVFGPDEPKVDEPKVARRLNNADWHSQTLRAAATGQAFIHQAIAHLNSRAIPAVVEKWFGNNDDSPTRVQIKRVLNGIALLLDNVEYVYAGDECDALTYAYVYPQEPWNRNQVSGKFLFYLCDYYMKVDDSEKIETLTHEGAHHLPMATTDSQYVFQGNIQAMYGRPICEAVALDCKNGNQDACSKARVNADSLSFFINDAALAHTTNTDTGGIVTLVTPGPSPAPPSSAAQERQRSQKHMGGLFGSFR